MPATALTLFLLSLFCLCSCGLGNVLETMSPLGHWSCQALDDSHLALTGDYAPFMQQAFVKYRQEKDGLLANILTGWREEVYFSGTGAEVIAQFRPRIARQLQNFSAYTITTTAHEPLAITTGGYWLNPTGQARFPDKNGQERMTHNAEVAHFIFLTLSRPLVPDEHLSISLPPGEQITFTYNPEQPSPLFKINQLGYAPAAREKYAYIGAWQGTGGPLPIQRFIGKPFHLIDTQSRQIAYTGKIKARIPDPLNDELIPFTGEEVAELDFSTFQTPGRFFLQIDGIGRSHDFDINGKTIAEAFYIHMKGLYHKRCGIAKERPYTNWTCPACHLDVVRGSFPPDISHYSIGSKDCGYGFFTADNTPINVSHFQLITLNRPEKPEILHLPGGWHDAADYDRRPFHLSIVGNLCAVYMLRPQNFSDGQLNIPESGNGIPDILDEACWGLRHLVAAQQQDGGVGTWIETIRHPDARTPLPPNEGLTYYLSRATRASSLEYAAYAAMLGLALKLAKANEPAELFADSARRAFLFAINVKNSRTSQYKYIIADQPTTIFYHEPPDLKPELLLKAGFNLAEYYHDATYLDPAVAIADQLCDTVRVNTWRWSPLIWAEWDALNRATQPFSDIDPVIVSENRFSDAVNMLRDRNKTEALLMQEQLEKNYPYRIPWHGPHDTWVHAMSWGNYHPLRRALTIVAAHGFSGWRNFLDSIYVANDFHNGANPSGSTMTSGLGRVYPVRFLDLISYRDGIAEFVPGITPYRNTYGISREDIMLAHGLYLSNIKTPEHAAFDFDIFTETSMPIGQCANKISHLWPIWRRWANVEAYTVDASEYGVWETIGTAAAATGYLLDKPYPPDPAWINRQPVDDIRKLPGYAPLP